MADIFISHSSSDNKVVDIIKTWLERDRSSWSVFLDKHPRDGILAGQGWQEQLRKELRSCRLVLAVVTEDWLASKWCFTEAVTADFQGKDFIAVLPNELPDTVFQGAPSVVNDRQRQLLDFSTGFGWSDLLHALDNSGLDPNQWFAIPKQVGPYPGFVAFEEKDAGVFFGRNQEITQYLNILKTLKSPDLAQAFVISGGSGSGKSSLLKAGLIPRVRRQTDWLVIAPFDLSWEPVYALFSALQEAANTVQAEIDIPETPPSTVESLVETLQRIFRAIENQANAWILLALDQAEVMLTKQVNDDNNSAFFLLNAVGHLLASRNRKLVAVLTIRTEFLPALERVLPAGVRFHNESLPLITALSEVVEKPAARFGITLEEGLSGMIVEETRSAEALPLLAYTLKELYERHGADKHLTVKEYQMLGGVEGAIEKKLSEVLADPRPSNQAIVAFRHCFVRQLVRTDENAIEGTRYTRGALAFSEAPEAAHDILKRLELARLLITDNRGNLVIAHDRLIKDWPGIPLKTWLNEDSDARNLLARLKTYMDDYKSGGSLLTDKALLDAKELLKSDYLLQDEEPELVQFVQQSLDVEEQYQRNQIWKFRGFMAAAFVFLCVAMGAMGFYLEANKQEKTAMQEKANAVRQKELTEEAMRKFEEQSQLAFSSAYGLHLAQVNSLLYSDPHLAKELLRDQKRFPMHLRDFSWKLLYQQVNRVKFVLPHNGPVFRIAFSPNSNILASTSYEESSIYLWDTDRGTRLAALTIKTDEYEKDFPYSLIFGSSGQTLISGHADGSIRLWNVHTGDYESTLKGHTQIVNDLDLSHDGKILASSSPDDIVLWDMASERQLIAIEAPNQKIASLSFSPDGKLLAYAGEENTLILWDVGKSQLHNSMDFSIDQRTEFIRDIEFSPNGKLLAAANDKGTIKLWKRGNREAGDVIEHGSRLSSIAFSPDGKILAWTSVSAINFFDTQVSKRLPPLKMSEDRAILDISFSPDGKTLATAGFGDSASFDGEVMLWNILNKGGLQHSIKGHSSSIKQLSYSPDGRLLASASEDGVVKIWKNDSMTLLATLIKHDSEISNIEFSPDGQTIAASRVEGSILLWDVKTQILRATIDKEDTGPVIDMVFLSNEMLLASLDKHGGLRLWKYNGELHKEFHLIRQHPMAITLDSVDKSLLLVSKYGDIEPLNFDENQTTQANPEYNTNGSVAVAELEKLIVQHSRKLEPSSPERVLESSSPERVDDVVDINQMSIEELQALIARRNESEVWRNHISAENFKPKLSDHVFNDAFALTPDNSTVALYRLGTIKLNDREDPKSTRVITKHLAGKVLCMDFSADGLTLATGNADGTIRLWHVATGMLSTTLSGHTGNVTAIEFSPDGTSLVSGSADGTIKFWGEQKAL